MDFESIRNVVTFVASVATILNFLFTHWHKMKLRFMGSMFNLGTLIWWIAGTTIIVGFFVLVTSLFQGIPVSGFSRLATLGWAMMFSGTTVLLCSQIWEQISWKSYRLIWFSIFWGFLSFGMTIVFVQLLLTH